MEGGRGRRQTVVDGRGGKKFKNALQELAELRKSGGKGASRFEIKEEEKVYDEVDEDEYARIVQKRREEGGAHFTTIFLQQNYHSFPIRHALARKYICRWICRRRR